MDRRYTVYHSVITCFANRGLLHLIIRIRLPTAQKRHAAHVLRLVSYRRIRSPAGEPRRLRQSTGLSLRAAFRIRPPTTTKNPTPKGVGFFVAGLAEMNLRNNN